MVREFDERNLAKSRAVCAAVAEEADTGKRRLTERERRILDMWPRFEDTGEPVMVGDAYVDTDGDDNIVAAVRFDRGCADLVGAEGFYTGFDPGERVKRPEPKVLDADGVEIKVGDTVYGIGRTEHQFEVIDPHHIDPEVGEAFSVRCYDSDEHEECHCKSKLLTHTRPDSWERLEEDAESIRQTIAYNFGDFSPSDFKRSGDSLQDRVSDIVRRAKALAGVEQ